MPMPRCRRRPVVVSAWRYWNASARAPFAETELALADLFGTLAQELTAEASANHSWRRAAERQGRYSHQYCNSLALLASYT